MCFVCVLFDSPLLVNSPNYTRSCAWRDFSLAHNMVVLCLPYPLSLPLCPPVARFVFFCVLFVDEAEGMI